MTVTYDEFMDRVSSNIRRFREEQDMMQKVLAIDAGISVTALCNYEHGLRCIDLYVAKRIADALGVTLEELVE